MRNVATTKPLAAVCLARLMVGLLSVSCILAAGTSEAAKKHARTPANIYFKLDKSANVITVVGNKGTTQRHVNNVTLVVPVKKKDFSSGRADIPVDPLHKGDFNTIVKKWDEAGTTILKQIKLLKSSYGVKLEGFVQNPFNVAKGKQFDLHFQGPDAARKAVKAANDILTGKTPYLDLHSDR